MQKIHIANSAGIFLLQSDRIWPEKRGQWEKLFQQSGQWTSESASSDQNIILRNELIADVLVACNVMEAAGTGFDKITEEYKEADEKHKPYIFSSSDHFTLVLPDLTYGPGIENGELPAITYVPIPGCLL